MPSFDVVSELDKHEVQNAVDNAIKELDRRYDLKGKGTFEFKDKEQTVMLTAEEEFQLEAMLEILRLALVKRKIDVKCLETKDPYASGKERNRKPSSAKASTRTWPKDRCHHQGWQAESTGRHPG